MKLIRIFAPRPLLFSVAIFGLLTAFAAKTSAAGFDYDPGLRARALGGAFRAIADDWSAAAYNPAGIAFMPDNQLGLNMAFLHNRWEYTPNMSFSNSSGATFASGYANGVAIPNQHGIMSAPEAGFVIKTPLWGETNIGLSIYQSYDQNVQWTLYRGLSDFSPAEIPSNHFSNNLDVVNFQFSAAHTFKDEKLALGLGISALRGDLVYSDLTLRQNPLDQSLIVRPFEYIPEITFVDGNGWSLGLKLGALYHASEKLDFAFVAQPKSTITISGAANFSFNMPFDPVTHASTAIGEAEHYLTGGQVVRTNADFETKLVTPAQIGLGSAYQVNDKCQVSFDIEYTMWSQYKGLAFTYSNFDTLNISAPTEPALLTDFTHANLSDTAVWDNAVKLSYGVSYALRPFFSVLAGLTYDQGAASQETSTPQFTDNGGAIVTSVGLHFTTQGWDLVALTSINNQPDLNVANASDINSDGIFDNLPGTIGGRSYQTVLGFTYRF